LQQDETQCVFHLDGLDGFKAGNEVNVKLSDESSQAEIGWGARADDICFFLTIVVVSADTSA